MYSFQAISAKELSELIHGKNPFDIEIPNSITKFKESIPKVDFSKPQEIPPTPLILTAEGIPHVLLHGGSGLEGKYTLFVVFVYAFGGKIHYTELSSGNYKATVTWTDA